MKQTNQKLLIAFISIALTFTTFYCPAQNQSEDTYKVLEEMDVKVPMRDGIRLSTNIYRPDAAGKFPVLLVRSPYGNGKEGNGEAHFFARKGYAVVLQDTRGRYESEGVFDAMQPEALDGYDTQQWVGEQPWCNGKIGTFGGSYVGYTQWMPAPLHSPYLVTMFPVVTFSDFHDVVYQNGAFFLELITPWSFGMTKPYVISNSSMGDKLDSVLITLPLIEQDRAMGWRISFLRDWLSHREKDRYWKRTSVGDNYDQIRASVYNIGGWYDILLKSTINNYLKMTGTDIDPEIRKKQKLLIGPWDHGVRGPQLGDLDFGETSVLNRRELMLRWFDNQLRGVDNGIMEEPPVKIFVMGTNHWRYENEWPLARTEYRDYYFHSRGDANTLHGKGSLETKQSKKEMTDHFMYDPEEPVPTIGTMGPHDMRSVEERSDVLVYTSPPLKKDLEVTGPVRAIIYASSSAVNTDFTTKLVDVYPDGRAIRICEGIIRADHRDPDAPPSNIVPEKIYQFQIDLWATSNVFLKGHRMRVEISSSNFPRFDRNLNSGLDFATDTTLKKAAQTIYHGGDYPSSIILPVIND